MTASSRLKASRLSLPAERHFEQYLAATLASQLVCLPANYESLYARVVTKLHAHLASNDGASARTIIRPLIERIVVQPGSARGGKRRAIQLYGDLYRMLAFAEGACATNAQQTRLLRDGPVVIPLVAGTAPIGNLQVLHQTENR